MTKQKTGMTWEQHLSTGKEIKDIRKKLFSYIELFGNAYNKTDKVNTSLQKVIDNFDLLRNHLDNRVSSEYPDKPDQDVVNIYYGNE